MSTKNLENQIFSDSFLLMANEVKKSVILPEEMWQRIEASMYYRGMDSFNQWARMAFMNEIRETDSARTGESETLSLIVNELISQYRSKKNEPNPNSSIDSKA